MAKAKNTAASKLGYEDVEITTIDGRKVKMGDYFKPEDFAIDDNNTAVIKHDGMQRVLFDLFRIKERTIQVHESPQKSNEWCAVVSVMMVVEPKVPTETKENKWDRSFTWEAVADCRTSNAMPGMGRYTTAIAETRASGRAIRRLLGLEGFCTKEELAETTLDVDDDTGPIQPAQLLLIKDKFLGDKKNGITLETINKRLKRKEGDEGFITSDEPDELRAKLTIGQAADLIAKLHRYDIEGAKE
jgi:hypothetical protein